jgi:hypothetical protein
VPATLLIEPWSEDYTAPPGARLKLLVRASAPDLWFNVVSHEDGTAQVYLEGEATRLAPLEWEALWTGPKSIWATTATLGPVGSVTRTFKVTLLRTRELWCASR